ncbi:MAG TPA: DNA-3-methyladenine glycosylase [Rubrobacter sp.]|nr:DNA-3-methyladenine glycosylase [Rubrobacter sp.]
MFHSLRGRARPRRALPPHNRSYWGAGISQDVLKAAFYDRDPRQVAVDLLGCVLSHDTPEGRTAGVIVETEAYRPDDPACHAYKGPTIRNRNIFGPPGIAYVYLSYGTHNLLNVVCEPEGVGSAVLIRALRPSDGEDLMERRRGRARDLCNGPGRLTQALGVDLSYDGQDLTSGSLTISDKGAPPEGLVETTRIGITRGTDLPWRYLIDSDEHVSVRPKTISGRR